MLSKITPEPTPVSGMTPYVPELALPVTVIRTTAGLTLAATAIVADDSSMVTGWVVPALVASGTLVVETTGRSSAPVAPRARTVPPDARTADSSETATSEPPRPRDRPVSGAGLAAVVGTAAGAGSYQRSGVTGGVCSHERAHSERGSGAGVKRSSGTWPSAEAGVVQVSDGARYGSVGDRSLGARRRDRRGRHGLARFDRVTLGQVSRVGGVGSRVVVHLVAGPLQATVGM